MEDSNRDTGILIVSDSKNSNGGTMEASALPFTTAQLSNKTAVYEIPERTHTALNIDYASRGLGGESCGPKTLAQYRLENDGRDYSYAYTIVPYSKGAEPLTDLAKVWR